MSAAVTIFAACALTIILLRDTEFFVIGLGDIRCAKSTKSNFGWSPMCEANIDKEIWVMITFDYWDATKPIKQTIRDETHDK